MSLPSDSTALTVSSLEVDSIFDALVGWGDVERAFDLTRSERQRAQFGYGPERLREDEQLLLRAMRHPRARLRIIAAELGQDWPSVMAMALRDSYWRVRATGAASDVAPPELLAELVNESSAELRRCAARNEALPVSALVHLLDDPDMSVREAAAEHPELPMMHMLRLAEDPEPGIRRIMARRALPTTVLDRLARDPESSVSDAVATNPDASAEALHVISRRTTNNWARQAVIDHPRSHPEDVLRCVANMTDSWTTRRFAEKTDRTDFMLLLAQSATEAVRAALLENPALTPEAMALFPLDAPVAEHRATVAHANVTWPICRRLATHYLTSNHYGRRNIGRDFVHIGINRPGRPTDVPRAVAFGRADRLALLDFLSECG